MPDAPLTFTFKDKRAICAAVPVAYGMNSKTGVLDEYCPVKNWKAGIPAVAYELEIKPPLSFSKGMFRLNYSFY